METSEAVLRTATGLQRTLSRTDTEVPIADLQLQLLSRGVSALLSPASRVDRR